MNTENNCVKISGTIHFYCEDQICDEAFFAPDNDTSGVIPMTIMIPLRGKRFFECDVVYSGQTTVGEVLEQIVDSFNLDEDYLINEATVYFLGENDRFNVFDRGINFLFLKNKYFDPDKTDKISIEILIGVDAGCVDEYETLRFYFHSKESGSHNEPHVHVCNLSREYEASISLVTGKLLAGEMPRKLLKKARKRIKDRQWDFLNWWNALTDGLKVDVNHSLGLIEY